MGVRLRILEDADLDRLFEWERDPHAVAMAAFTRANPSDRAVFDEHYKRIRNDPDVTLRAIEDDGALAGMIASFTMEGERKSPTGLTHPDGVEGLHRRPSTHLLRSR